MLKAIKIRIYPDSDQINYLSNLFGSSRFIYNKCLDYKKEQYDLHKKSVSYCEIGKYLTGLKCEFTWLRDVHSKVLQQSLRDMETAYKNFFDHKFGFPKFKSRHKKQSVRFPVDAFIGVRGNRIDIIRPLKDILFKASKRDLRYLNKNSKSVKNSTLSKTRGGKYYLSILIDTDNETTKKPVASNDIIGIDLGVKDFVVSSNKVVYENIKFKTDNRKKLKKLHQNLSRKKIGGKNRNKARVKLARFYEKINNQKEYYLHQTVNKLLDENQIIVIEDLSVKSMMMKGESSLARGLAEASFSRFVNILEYKAEWYDREIIKINRYFPSSKLCNVCGWKYEALSLKEREWVCQDCNTKHDRDYNAALNIYNEGVRILKVRDIEKENKG